MKIKKISLFFLILASCAVLTYSLQLSRSQQTHQVVNNRQNHNYYGRHWRNQRTHQYIQKVKEDNFNFIDLFNNKNKKALKAVRGLLGSSSSNANAFSMVANKFVEFTEDQFDHLFKGYKPHGGFHAHEQTIDQHLEAVNTIQHQKQTHQMNIARLLLKSHASESMQSNHEQVILHQKEESHDLFNYQHNGIIASLLGYENPYQLDNKKIKSLYGNTNDPSRYGWDWQKLDPNYYKQYKTDFFKNWQTDRWGFNVDNNAKSGGDWWDSIWDQGSSKPASTSSSSISWWNNWNNVQSKNKNNDNWWNSVVQWWDTPVTPNKPVGPVSPNWPVAPVNPVGPVAPIRPGSNNSTPSNLPVSKRKLDPYPSNAVQVNWALRGGTTHIKNQGQCGSCWSFAALGTIQSYYVIQGRGIMDLSEQMLVDCSKQSYGCQGGNVDPSFDYVIRNGLVTQDKYPYRGLNQRCIHATGPNKISRYTTVRGSSQMQQYLKLGPLAGAIAASGKTFQFYSQGIFDKCASTKLDHAIVIVGYTRDYWIIRNSWGADWGEQGHMRIKRSQNNNNACGIQTQSFAITG